MDPLDHPSVETWEARREWFENTMEEAQHPLANYILSEQACAMTADLQAAFCAGAWAAVIVLAAAVIDASLREEAQDFRGGAAALVDGLGANPELHSLRRRRNRLVHVGPDDPAITVDDQWGKRDELEAEARKAILLMWEAMFMSPGL